MTIDRGRYLRQIDLEEFGESGQCQLANASVLIVGVGGLGSPIATLLTSSGVGRIGIVDNDVVSLSNLPRQTLYTQNEIGESKVECAKRRLQAMNNDTIIEGYNLRLDRSNAESIIARYDIVVDGTDNPESRYLIDEICGKLNKPYIYGAIRGFEGQVSIFHHRGSGSYSSLYPRESLPANLTPPPVMSTTPAIIGAIEANEVIKVIINHPTTLSGTLLTIDLRDYTILLAELTK